MHVYREYLPSVELASYVDCYWTAEYLENLSQNVRHSRRVLPDAGVELIFNFFSRGDFITKGAHSVTYEASNILGMQTGPILLRPSEAKLYGIGIRFKAGGTYPFFGGIPVHELTDRMTSLRNCQLDRYVEIEEKLLNAPLDPALHIQILETDLKKVLRSQQRETSRLVTRGIKRIQESGGRLQNAQLCDELGSSRQHLARIFNEQVGISPKAFSKITRFTHLLREIDEKKALDWDEFALTWGYFDQAHFINDFKAYTGYSPAAYSQVDFTEFHFSNKL